MQATNVLLSEISKRMGNRKEKKKKKNPNKYRDEDISTFPNGAVSQLSVSFR